jgi:hypothetical protein
VLITGDGVEKVRQGDVRDREDPCGLFSPYEEEMRDSVDEKEMPPEDS